VLIENVPGASSRFGGRVMGRTRVDSYKALILEAAQNRRLPPPLPMGKLALWPHPWRCYVL